MLLLCSRLLLVTRKMLYCVFQSGCLLRDLNQLEQSIKLVKSGGGYQVRENAEKNRIITRGLLLIFTLIVLFSLSGCWGLMELDKRVLVSMVAIDRDEDGKIKLSVGLIDPRKVENKESTAIIIYTGTGETLHEASRNFISLTGKLLMWPYIKMIIIGPTIAKDDILSFLDYFNRKNEIQPNPYIFISNAPAEEIINLKTGLSNIPSVIVEDQIKNQDFLSYAPQVRLYCFGRIWRNDCHAYDQC